MKRNIVVFVCGRRASGKSVLLARYGVQFPRRLLHDPVGEFAGTIPGAYECYTLAEAREALADAAAVSRWTLVACLDEADMAEVAGLLAPLGRPDRGYARAVGGVCVESGEIDLLAPPHAGIDRRIRNLLQRGRHHGVSLLLGTQRPRDVHRVVTSQADAIALFRQHEPRDLEYVASSLSSALVDVVRELPRYHYVLYVPLAGTAHVVDATGRTVRAMNAYTGEEGP